MRAQRFKLVLVVMVVGGALVSLSASTAAVTTPRATLATFAGEWGGHTRSLTIKRDGVAVESIGDGCCDPIVDLTLQLSKPIGTTREATVLATVTSVSLHDRTAFTKADPAPRVGDSGRLRLKNGVITETLTGTIYCTTKPGYTWTCGA